MEDKLSISIVIPTYNSEKVLDKCLNSICKQKYLKEKIEIIIDGGSIGKTLDTARKYNADKIFTNPLKTRDAGKSIGVDAAKTK